MPVSNLNGLLFIMKRSYFSSPIITDQQNVAAIVHRDLVYIVDVMGGVATITYMPQAEYTGQSAESWAISKIGPGDYIVISSDGRGIPHNVVEEELDTGMLKGLRSLSKVLDGPTAPDLKDTKILGPLQEAMGLGSGARPVISDYISEIEGFKALIESRGTTEPAAMRGWITESGPGDNLDNVLGPKLRKPVPYTSRPGGIIEAELGGVIFQTPASKTLIKRDPHTDIDEITKILDKTTGPLTTEQSNVLSELREPWMAENGGTIPAIKDRLLRKEGTQLTIHNVDKELHDIFSLYHDAFQISLQPGQNVEAFGLIHQVGAKESASIMGDVAHQAALLKKYPLKELGYGEAMDFSEIMRDFQAKYAKKTMFVDIETIGLADRVPLLPYEIGIQIGNGPEAVTKVFRLQVPHGAEAEIWQDYLKLAQQFQGMEYTGKLEDIGKVEIERFMKKAGPTDLFPFTSSESEMLIKQMVKAGVIHEGKEIGNNRKIFVAPKNVEEIFERYVSTTPAGTKLATMGEITSTVKGEFTKIGVPLADAVEAGHNYLNFDRLILRQWGWDLEFGRAIDTLTATRQMHQMFSKMRPSELTTLIGGLDAKGINVRHSALGLMVPRATTEMHNVLGDVAATVNLLTTLTADANARSLITNYNVDAASGKSIFNLGEIVVSTQDLDKIPGIRMEESSKNIATVFKQKGPHRESLRFDRAAMHPKNPYKFVGLEELTDGNIGYHFQDLLRADRTVRLVMDPQVVREGLPLKTFEGGMGDLAAFAVDTARRRLTDVRDLRHESFAATASYFEIMHQNMKLLANEEKYNVISAIMRETNVEKGIKDLAGESIDGSASAMLTAKAMLDLLGGYAGAEEAIGLMEKISGAMTFISSNAFGVLGDEWQHKLLEKMKDTTDLKKDIWTRLEPTRTAGPENTAAELARTFLAIDETVMGQQVRLGIKMADHDTMQRDIARGLAEYGDALLGAVSQKFGTPVTNIDEVFNLINSRRGEKDFLWNEDIKIHKENIKVLLNDIFDMENFRLTEKHIFAYQFADVLLGKRKWAEGVRHQDPSIERGLITQFLGGEKPGLGAWQRARNQAVRMEDPLLHDFLGLLSPVKTAPGDYIRIPDELMRPLIHTGRSRTMAAIGLAAAMIGVANLGAPDPTFHIQDDPEYQIQHPPQKMRDRVVHVDTALPTEKMAAITSMINREYGGASISSSNISAYQVAQALEANLI